MANPLKSRFKFDKNILAFHSAFLFIVLLIIALIATFFDIVYVVMIWNALPEGILRLAAVGGTILVGPIILLLLLAKLFYFRSGGQQIWSYIIFFVELILAGLNTYTSFQIAWGNGTDSFVTAWRNLSPLAPVIAMILLVVLLILDPNARRRNEEREHEEAVKDADHEYQMATLGAKHDLRMKALDDYKALLEEEQARPDVHARLREGARRVVDEALLNLTGLPRYVDSSPAAPPTQQPTALPSPQSPPSPAPADVERMAQITHGDALHLENLLGKENYQALLRNLVQGQGEKDTSPLAQPVSLSQEAMTGEPGKNGKHPAK